ncbi:MAG: LemA family protein [Alphaproteobacteria bacterium ADurb.Bin438]|nr:MAG: LemA family protein [Alphaproteobacteria bacterium ADurb.Bin438]
MESLNIMALFFITIFILLAFLVVSIYNSLVKQNQLSDEAFSGIDVALKRRYDLIPNLVETVKGYAKHEQETLTKVIAQRKLCEGSGSVEARANNENILSGMLKSVFALSEAYPELKANTNFMKLQDSLDEIEDALQNARRYYNATVRDFNILVKSFPSNIIANQFNFKEKEFFEITDMAQKENVKVAF